jgi:hypothetical protein
VIVTESVESVAVIVTDPAVRDFTVKVATPEAFEVAEAGETVSEAPRLELIVTVFPETPFEVESFKVTVMVEVLVPFATRVVGVALTVD